MKNYLVVKEKQTSFKMNFRYIVGIIVSSLLLIGCASSKTPYVPASDAGDVGYSESKLSSDRYRVSYTGRTNAPLELVQDYALLRAAELTVAQNYDWFEVADRTITPHNEGDNSARVGVELGAGTTSQTRCGLLGCRTTQTSPGFPRSSVDFPAQREHFVASIEILMGNGEHERSANIYDAREVISSIRAKF